jgi:hypothetical protein
MGHICGQWPISPDMSHISGYGLYLRICRVSTDMAHIPEQ